MSGKPSFKMSRAFGASFLLVAAAVSLGAQSAAAASRRHAAPVAHRVHQGYAAYRSPHYAPRATLPYSAEYGFLTHIPANAIRMPGYIFVPGVGILGESCDLPTSACPNEYRDHI